jgi:hypothetical protein
MKVKERKEKLLALQAAVSGNLATLRQYQQQQQKETFFMVVCNNGSPEPSDLVDVRLPDQQGRKRIPYADFLENPAVYGSFCITAD